MITEFDEKGKLYTDIVLKKTLQATIQTITHRIHGELHIRPDERLTDELIRSQGFLAITNVTVYDSRGQLVYQSEFLSLNKDQIIWVIPDEEIANKADTGGRG
jgi:hypothetical protein